MSKFNTPTKARPAGRSFLLSEQTPTTRTHNGGPGYLRETRSELFLLAVTNFVGETTFYESAHQRDNRFGQLVRTVAAEPDGITWLTGFGRWLRTEANMRSAALVLAAETVHERLAKGLHGGNRQIVNTVLQRADEPGEFLAYWTSHYGRNLPKPVRRGVADAALRLYNERSLLKYDTDSKGYRFADVIRLTHPEPKAAWQSDLFEYAIGRRLGFDVLTPRESLLMIRENIAMKKLSPEQARALLFTPNDLTADAATALAAAGMTWEQIPALVNGPWTAAMWEAIIPSMGYMALLRNLRNFDQAGVSDAVAEKIGARLADPEQVARSRQLPMRFLSAYNAAPSLRWGWHLEKALDASLANIPRLPGRTLILIDTSGSMHAGFSKDGSLHRWDAATMFGLALARRCEDTDIVSYSNHGKRFRLEAGESLLRALERWRKEGYFLAGGTNTAGAVRSTFAGHDRVVILTDEQAGSGWGVSSYGVDSMLPQLTPLYTFNLAGYQAGHAPSGTAYRHTFGGLTDACFKLIPLLESGRNATAWPWEQ